jgi:hypothetical protein
MEDWIARIIASGSALGTIAAAVIGWKVHNGQKAQHNEALKQLRTQHGEELAHFERELGVLRESLDESRRQWEEGGRRIEIDGTYKAHATDRRADEIHLTVANTGRLRAFIDDVRIIDVINVRGVSIAAEEPFPIAVEPGGSLRLSTTRGDMVDKGFSDQGDGWWKWAVVEVYTGDGKRYQWSPDSGMDPDLSFWP